MPSNKDMRRAFGETITPFFEEGLPALEQRLSALEAAFLKIITPPDCVPPQGEPSTIAAGPIEIVKDVDAGEKADKAKEESPDPYQQAKDYVESKASDSFAAPIMTTAAPGSISVAVDDKGPEADGSPEYVGDIEPSNTGDSDPVEVKEDDQS